MHTFATAKGKRKVAQLVAHYVRDVGVGRSSRLFPTQSDNRSISIVAFVFITPPTTKDEDVLKKCQHV